MGFGIYYDVENVGLHNNNKNSFNSINNVLNEINEYIKRTGEDCEIIKHKAYYNPAGSAARFPNSLTEYGIEQKPVPTPPNEKRKSNMVDMKMIVDIVSDITENDQMHSVIIATGDKDFSFLADNLRQKGIKVVVVADCKKMPASLLSSCDEYLPLRLDEIDTNDIKTFFSERIKKERNVSKNPSSVEGAIFGFILEICDDQLLERFIASSKLKVSTFKKLVIDKYGSDIILNSGTADATMFLARLLKGTKLCIAMVDGKSTICFRSLVPEDVNVLEDPKLGGIELNGFLTSRYGLSEDFKLSELKTFAKYCEKNINTIDKLVHYIDILRASGLMKLKVDGYKESAVIDTQDIEAAFKKNTVGKISGTVLDDGKTVEAFWDAISC